MTERSKPWNSTTVGDATEAPYDAPTEWAEFIATLINKSDEPQTVPPALWRSVFMSQLNQLAVTGTASPVSIDTGRALVNGTWYYNDVAVTVVIPTPAALTRIDRIVLRKDWALQTVRVTRIAGTEGGAAPDAVQTAGVTWDAVLANVSITTGGVITVSDQRQYVENKVIPFASVRLNAAQLLVSSVLTAIIWDTQVTDTDNLWVASAPTRFTISKTGIYRIFANAQPALAIEGYYSAFRMEIHQNGVMLTPPGIMEAFDSTTAAQGTPPIRASLDVLLTRGDYIEIFVRQVNSGVVSRNTEQTVNPPYATITYLGIAS